MYMEYWCWESRVGNLSWRKPIFKPVVSDFKTGLVLPPAGGEDVEYIHTSAIMRNIPSVFFGSYKTSFILPMACYRDFGWKITDWIVWNYDIKKIQTSLAGNKSQYNSLCACGYLLSLA